MTHFVQYFPRLRIALRFDRRGLVAARKWSTPFAMVGSSHSVMSAVMRPSRPNGVLNHGVPAYG